MVPECEQLEPQLQASAALWGAGGALLQQEWREQFLCTP